MFIRDAINHFLDFHKGTLNIILHIIGFAGILLQHLQIRLVTFCTIIYRC